MTTKPYTIRYTCRVCGGEDLTPLFSLGDQYVSDFPEAGKERDGQRVPINLELCNRCSLVQQVCTAPPDFLYTRHYWYRSGVTQTMRDALRDVAESADKLVHLKSGDVVLDIGSNDGTLLRSYDSPEIVRIGVEPARNLWEEGSEGLDILVKDFWNGLTGQDKAPNDLKPKVVTACGMLYDLEDPNQFIADVKKVLHPEGVFIAQLMCLRQTLANRDVGNFAHEHLEFYSLASLAYLLQKHGLKIYDIEENSVNGGSYRIYAGHYSKSQAVHWWTKVMARRVDAAHRAEDGLGLNRPGYYDEWFRQMRQNRDQCVDFIRREVATGKKVWVYGASTKGNVILQWYGQGLGYLNHPVITAAADRSPEKVGRVMVGTGIPILQEANFRQAAPDYALVLPYAFRDEFLEREKEWRAGGGRFIFPLPSFEVV